MAKPGELTPKQSRFIDEYMIDLNATQAAIRAGYSKKTAKVIGQENLTKPAIASELKKRQLEVANRNGITQDRVLQELARIAFFDIRKLFDAKGNLLRPHELDDDAAAVLAGIDVVEMAGGVQIGGRSGEDGKDVPVQHIGMYTKKAKTFDKNTALTLAMKHLGILIEKTDNNNKNSGTVTHIIDQAPVVDKGEWLKAHGIGQDGKRRT